VCGRITSSARPGRLAERFRIEVPGDYRESFNLAPAQPTLIVRRQDCEPQAAALVRWGLLPHWARDERLAYKLINARAETLADKPAFRPLIARHRCLVLADGYYEWRVGADGRKEPIHFRLADGAPFAFAGLWTSRSEPGSGRLVESCTVITTRANECVAPVHDRMPVMLPRELEQDWLDPALPRAHVLSLLEPFTAEAMLAVPASRLVNSARNDGPRLLEPDPVAV
jgi:putative SOS response-associated peptidase YedK